jgi:hypothetical protein
VQLDKKWVIPYSVFSKFPPSGLEYRFQIPFYSSGVISPVRRQKLRYIQVTAQVSVMALFSNFAPVLKRTDGVAFIGWCAKVVVVKVLQWFSIRFLRRRRIIRHLLIPNLSRTTSLRRSESLVNDRNAGNSKMRNKYVLYVRWGFSVSFLRFFYDSISRLGKDLE